MMSDARRLSAAVALTDTFFPSVSRKDDPTGLFARRASEIWPGEPSVPRALLDYIATLPDPARSGLLTLIDLCGTLGLPFMPLAMREAALSALAASSPDIARGIRALRQITLVLCYGLVDARGRNPNWESFGYPGPPAITPPELRPLPLLLPRDLPGTTRLEADVVVIGSGAGGGVIAGELAKTGRSVLVLEAGGGYREDTYPPDELSAFNALYWRGGSTPAADGMLSFMAGATLGGGTAINWANCYPTPPWIRARWAREHGLDDIETPAFDEHLSAVIARANMTDALSEDYGANTVLRAGANALGVAYRRALRNAIPEGHSAIACGHTGYGDRSGSKQTTARTYLTDAAERGARILVRCKATRVLVERGRAVGVQAIWGEGEQRVELELRAAIVVVAAGALETPALLLRSGIGGPAVGRHFHAHPAAPLVGRYDDRVDPWLGGPHTTQVTEFLDRRDGYGFVIECSHFSPGLSAGVIQSPRTGREHKEVMSIVGHGCAFIGRVLDRGEGRITIDERGEAVVTYPLSDALDRLHMHECLEQLARLHRAAGAREVLDLGPGGSRWQRGEPFERFLQAMRAVPFTAGQRPYFSAHQMSSARIGRDSSTSVADPSGELHSTRGVWIGCGAACPTAIGANPMLTIMALARRTAQRIAEASPGRGLARAEQTLSAE